MRTLLSVAPLVSIPMIVTQAERTRHRRVVLYSWQGAIAGVIAMAVVIHTLVRPLDVIWAVLLRRLGV
jgi:hypothetical protein